MPVAPVAPCLLCAEPTSALATLNGHAVPLCEACLARATSDARRLCGACGRPLKRPPSASAAATAARLAAHEQRVLDALLALPEGSWRDLVRHARLSTKAAQAARDRLLAANRIECVAEARGYLGARYRVKP